MKKKLETLLAHIAENGQINDPYSGSHFPIYQTATFDLKKQKLDKVYDYTRTDNPTRDVLENVFSEVCGGAGCVCTHTGIAAVALLFETVLKSGSNILVEKDCYGGTYRLLGIYQKKYNIHVHYADFTQKKQIEKIFQENSIDLVFCESPTNPGLKIIDLKYIADLSKSHKTLFAVDNSLATFVSQRPIIFGADFEVFSTTKYVSGHGSVIAGALVARDKNWAEKIHYFANAGGRSQNPLDVFFIMIGIPTLFIRMKAHEQKALSIAKFLEKRTEVTRIRFPGLKTHPQYKLAKNQMDFIPGVLTIDMESEELAEKFIAKTKIFGEKASFGSPDSRMEIPSKISHASYSEDELKTIGIGKSTIRLSIGLENLDDLIVDLEQALA